MESIQHCLNTSYYSLWITDALEEIPHNFTITDPSISGHPIVFASRGFLKMTGYSKSEVIGKNGRMFQGPRTCRRSVMEVREAVREERAIQINLLNYRKDGTPFWILFHMCPVFSKEDGKVINFIAVQVPLHLSTPPTTTTATGFSRYQQQLGSCRRQVWSDSLTPAASSDVSEMKIEEAWEASDAEKNKAASGISRVLSVLTHYSESTGRVVCGKRCGGLSGGGLLSSSLTISLGRIKQSFVLTDPHLPDMPIVYASDAFLKLTGYSWHEVIGRNCRFLNGEDTDSSALCKIEENIQMERACTVRILSYRKNKSSFWNSLHVSPVRNASGKIAYIVGVHMLQESSYEQGQGEHGLSPEMKQLSTVGAVKIAVRSSSMGASSSSKS
uniref:Putative LOV domain-containing protein n=1 Tax=Cannabis sativa TaxID=3483 RepID=A0A126X0H2_CANSA|nr:putative LOV domain-containing protein [Cannabis sativa]